MSEDESLVGSESSDHELLEPPPRRPRGRPKKGTSLSKVRSGLHKTISTRSSAGQQINQPDPGDANHGASNPGCTDATAVPSGSSGAGSSSSTISSDQVSLLLSAINSSKRVVDQQLAEFCREIQCSTKEASDKLSRKLKSGRSVLEFKRKGNEKQYTFNEEVYERLDLAETELTKSSLRSLPKEASSPIRHAKDALAKGKKLLKLILLVDRSDHGWDVVKNYEADELAEGSEDEKKIQKVEKAAQKEAEKRAATGKKSAKGNKRPFLYTRDFRPGGFGASYTTWPDPRSAFLAPFTPSSYSGSRSSRPVAPVGPCHSYGEFGHLHYACPKLKMPNKYPFMVASDSGVNTDVVTCEGDTCCMNDGVNEQVVAPAVCQGYSSNSTPCVKGCLLIGNLL